MARINNKPAMQFNCNAGLKNLELAKGVEPNLRSKFDPEAPLSNATNRSIVGAEGPTHKLGRASFV